MNNQFSYSSLLVNRIILHELASRSSLSQTEIAFLLGISESSVDQPVQEEHSDLNQAYCHLLTGVLHHGLAIFDQKITPFIKWLKTPHPELACAQTGFLPEWPTTPPPALDQMTSFEPFDLIAYAAQRDRQSAKQKTTDPKRAYPTPFSLLHTADGIELVDAIFGRIEGGVFM